MLKTYNRIMSKFGYDNNLVARSESKMIEAKKNMTSAEARVSAITMNHLIGKADDYQYTGTALM